MTHHKRGHIRAAIVVFTSLIILSLTQSRVSAQQPNRVGLVIDFGNGVVTTRCVEFNEPEISGYDALRRSGLAVIADETSGMGVIICDIGNTSGCSASSCFCRCQGNDCTYWVYHRLDSGTWRYSPLGASATTLQHGDVDGWVWAEGNARGGTWPPVISFDQICGPNSGAPAATEDSVSPATRQPTATPTLPATQTPSPSPSSTPRPATLRPTRQTPSPSRPTDQPTAQPTATASPSPTYTAEPTSTPTPSRIQASATPVPQKPANGEEERRLPIPPGYAVFGLIALGLLGWLVYILRFRRQRA